MKTTNGTLTCCPDDQWATAVCPSYIAICKTCRSVWDIRVMQKIATMPERNGCAQRGCKLRAREGLDFCVVHLSARL